MSLLVFQSTDGSGKASPQLIYSFKERSTVICQVQGPGFIRLASSVETLTQSPPGGLNIDRNSGIVSFPWYGSLWGIAGGQQSAGKALQVTANFEYSSNVEKSITPDQLHAPLHMPPGNVPWHSGEEEDDYGKAGRRYFNPPSSEPKKIPEASFSDTLLTYDISAILKRIFHPILLLVMLLRAISAQTINNQDIPIDIRSLNFTIAKSVSLTPTIGAAFNSNFVFLNPSSQRHGMCLYITNDAGNSGVKNVSLGVFLSNDESPKPLALNGLNGWREATVRHGSITFFGGIASIGVGLTDAFYAETQGSLFIAVSPTASGTGDTFTITGAFVDTGNCGTDQSGLGGQTGQPADVHWPIAVGGMMRVVTPSTGAMMPLSSVPIIGGPLDTRDVLLVQPSTTATALILGNPVLPTGINGIQLSEKGPRWNCNSAPGAGVQASCTRAAGGVGVRHLIDCLSFSAGSSAAVTATASSVSVFDGATALVQYQVAITVAAGTGIQVTPPHSVCGLALIGTANTAMSISFFAAVTGANQAVWMTGYDVQ